VGRPKGERAEAAGVVELTVKHRLQELENLFRERIS
jgi:hypothetical protein